MGHDDHKLDVVLVQLARIEEFLLHLHKEIRNIMASQAELAASLTAVNTQLNDIATEVDKVSGETSTLVKAVADLTAALEAGGATSPEVDAALAAVQASTSALATKVAAVDDLVPDAAPTP